MSNVILEALDYKKIIIAKTNMSIKLNDILRNNKNSVLVNSHNVIDCAKTVSLVIEDDKFMEFIN